MAAFIAKQVVGDKLSSVKGAMGKDEEGGGDTEKENAEALEIEEARREMEEKRKEKHRKMEEEREIMRQGIRDKYGLKKKEELQEEEASDPMAEGRVGRKKKTPAELAAEANKDDSDDDEFATRVGCWSGSSLSLLNLREAIAGVNTVPLRNAAFLGVRNTREVTS